LLDAELAQILDALGPAGAGTACRPPAGGIR